MIPQTILSVVLFLGLIAPGLLQQLLWERRHPSLDQTAFREASRTALTSLLFSGLACFVIILLRIFEIGWVMDPGAYLRDPKAYTSQHYNLLIWTIILEVSLALLLVMLVHFLPVWIAKLPPKLTGGWVGPTSTYGVMTGGIWFEILRKRVPKDTEVWVSLRLTDGSQVSGYVSHYTSSAKAENREIAVQKPKNFGDMTIRDTKLVSPKRYLGRNWEYIIVRGDEITCMEVSYQPV
jgi:hypothetical protein